MTAIHFNTYDTEHNTGYANAAHGLCDALDQYIDITDKAFNIINFCRPTDYIFKPGLNIGYTPWESTEVPASWLEPMKQVDDLWTTSNWLKVIWEQKLDREVWVLEHAVDPQWQPIMRHLDGQKFRFIHVGEPAVRKGADIVLATWYKYFKDAKDVELVFKTTGYSQARVLDDDGSIVCSVYDLDNVIVIDKLMHPAELWREYALAQCMVYPSRGEGFGFIPLEAMATGLPTILPTKHMGSFARKSEFPLHTVKLEDVDNNYNIEHPGKWLSYNLEEIYEKMSMVSDSLYFRTSKLAYEIAKEIHKEYKWESIAERAMDRIESQLAKK